ARRTDEEAARRLLRFVPQCGPAYSQRRLLESMVAARRESRQGSAGRTERFDGNGSAERSEDRLGPAHRRQGLRGEHREVAAELLERVSPDGRQAADEQR